jgi:hypothetical protein
MDAPRRDMDVPRRRRLPASIRARLSYSNVISSIALFLALGGVSYAAVSLPRGSVGPKQLRAHAVTPSKLATGGVKKRSLSPWIRGQLARRAARGPVGPKGDTGPRGPAGPGGPGAAAVRYSAPAGTTPNPVPVLDVAGLSLSASCDQSGVTTTLNFSPRSAEAATLHETVTVDSGLDPTNSALAEFVGNLQIDLPAGTTLQTGGPSATAGYTRVAVQGVYSAPGTTIHLQLFATVNAENDRCSIDGVAVPA